MLEKTAVYRAFDESGSLLYVGISNDPRLRLETHRTLSRWGKSMCRSVVRWYASKELALNAEALAIFSEKPRFNLTGPTERLSEIFRYRVRREMIVIGGKKTRTSDVSFDLTDEDRAEIKAAATIMRLPLATFMRLAALKMARENG